MVATNGDLFSERWRVGVGYLGDGGPLPGDPVGFCAVRKVAKFFFNWDGLSGQG